MVGRRCLPVISRWMNIHASHVCTAVLVFSLSGCKHPTPQLPAAPVPPPSGNLKLPAIRSFKAEPETISPGQASVLSWLVDNAQSIRIEPELGAVPASDRGKVAPSKTTTYSLVASNSAGSVQAAFTVSVRPAPPTSPAVRPLEEQLRITNSQLRDIHFDYNGGELTPDEDARLHEDAKVLSELFRLDPKAIVAVEGHCDSRGSDEYNIGLGDRRATAVKEALVSLGLPATNLSIVSYGKERSVCDDENEECYARNRRVHFSAGPENGASESLTGRER